MNAKRHQRLTTIKQLQNAYKFVGKDVEKYLQNNKDLINILMEAIELIQKIFGEKQPLLEKVVDEVEDWSWEYLLITIKANCNYEDAENKGNQLYDEWYIKYADIIKSRLNYMIIESLIK